MPLVFPFWLSSSISKHCRCPKIPLHCRHYERSRRFAILCTFHQGREREQNPEKGNVATSPKGSCCQRPDKIVCPQTHSGLLGTMPSAASVFDRVNHHRHTFNVSPGASAHLAQVNSGAELASPRAMGGRGGLKAKRLDLPLAANAS